MKHFKTTLTIVTTAGLLALTACGGTTSANDSTVDQAGEPTPGGTLRFAVGSDTGCFDPHQVGSNDSIYSVRTIADSLTDQDPETGEIVPWLAESWEINDDVTEFTFTLQDGVTFSDGTPLDAEAVAANFDAVENLGSRAGLTTGYLQDYEETEIHDDLSFTVKFSESNAQFLQASSTHSLSILHPESVTLDDDTRCEGVIGSGPFVLEEHVHNDHITLSAREDYDWGSSLWSNQSAPYLEGIEFSVVPESGVRAGSLQSGQVDVIGNIAPQDQAGLESAGAELLSRTNPGIAMGLRVNHDNDLLADQAVREALAIGINREEIASTVYPEGTPAATSILSGTTPAHKDLSDRLTYDPQRAAQLLEEAGLAENSQGVLERDGQPLELDLLWFNVAATNSAAVELIQQQLDQIGVKINLEEGQTAEWNSRLIEGSFDLNWSNITRADGDILRTEYDTDLANNSRLTDTEELNDLLREQATTLDNETRTALLGEAQEYIVSNYLTIPVIDLTTIVSSRAGVHGVRFDSGARVHLNDVWIQDAAS